VNPLVDEEKVIPIEEQDTKVEAAAEEEVDIFSNPKSTGLSKLGVYDVVSLCRCIMY